MMMLLSGEELLNDAIKEALPDGDTSATSDENTTDAAMPVPTFTDVLRSIDNIRSFVRVRDTIGNLLLDIAELKRKLLLCGSRKF